VSTGVGQGTTLCLMKGWNICICEAAKINMVSKHVSKFKAWNKWPPCKINNMLYTSRANMVTLLYLLNHEDKQITHSMPWTYMYDL
jgi:hypothetical protein